MTDIDAPIDLTAPPAVPLPVQSEIAVTNLSSAWSPTDFAFIVRAIEIQVMRDFLPLWRDAMAALGCPVMPVCGYSAFDGLAPGSFAPVSVLDDIQQAGALGFHDWELAAWGRSKPDSVTLSHEVLELLADPRCDGWCPGPNGLVAREVADPCEDQTYGIDVTLGGETRTIKVSNFVTPRYFEMAFGPSGQPYDYLGLLTGPFTVATGGYQIVKAADGTVSDVFADTGHARARALAKAWFTRTGRRLGLARL